MSSTGVVVALRFEARCLGAARRAVSGLTVPEGVAAPEAQAILSRLPDGALLGISGMGDEAAAHTARALLRAGATALLSYGVAGALDPSLEPGTVLLASQIVREPQGSGAQPSHATDAAWREVLQRALGGRLSLVTSTLLTTAQPIAEPERKRALFESTGAAAVDMESSAVAEVAAEARVPFMALRVILDTAADRLPRSVERALRPGANHVPMPGLLILMFSPGDWPALMRLSSRRRVARRSLRRCARYGALTRVPGAAPEPAHAGPPAEPD